MTPPTQDRLQDPIALAARGLSPVFIASVASEPLVWLVDALRDLGASPTLLTDTDSATWRASTPSLARRLTQAVASLRLWRRALRDLPAPAPQRPWVVVSTPPWLPTLFTLLSPTPSLRAYPPALLIHDLFPEALALRAPSSLSASLRAAAWWIWRPTLAAASSVVFIGERQAEAARAQMLLNRSAVIYTGAPALAADDAQAAPCALPLRISYVGYMGHMHDWRALSFALHRLKNDPRVEVTISSSGPGYQKLLSAHPAAESACNIRLLPPLPHAEWLSLLKSSHVSLVTLKEGAERASVPSKMFSALAASNAILGVVPEGSDAAALLRRWGCGAVCSPGDGEGLVRSLLGWADALGEVEQLRARAQAVARRYGVEEMARAWVRFFTGAGGSDGEADASELAGRGRVGEAGGGCDRSGGGVGGGGASDGGGGGGGGV